MEMELGADTPIAALRVGIEIPPLQQRCLGCVIKLVRRKTFRREQLRDLLVIDIATVAAGAYAAATVTNPFRSTCFLKVHD